MLDERAEFGADQAGQPDLRVALLQTKAGFWTRVAMRRRCCGSCICCRIRFRFCRQVRPNRNLMHRAGRAKF